MKNRYVVQTNVGPSHHTSTLGKARDSTRAGEEDPTLPPQTFGNTSVATPLVAAVGTHRARVAGVICSAQMRPAS